MALRVMTSSDSDVELAKAIHEVLVAGERTPFRQLVLDLIRDSVADLYDTDDSRE